MSLSQATSAPKVKRKTSERKNTVVFIVASLQVKLILRKAYATSTSFRSWTTVQKVDTKRTKPGIRWGELAFGGGDDACYRYDDSLTTKGGRACSFAGGTTPVRDDIETLSIFGGRPKGPSIRSEPIEPARAPPSNKTFIGLLFYMNGVANLFDSIKQLTSIHLKLIPTLVMSGSVNV